MMKNMTTLDNFKRFAMHKYLIFKHSFNNTFQAVTRIILGRSDEPDEDTDDESTENPDEPAESPDEHSTGTPDNGGDAAPSSDGPDEGGSHPQDSQTSEGEPPGQAAEQRTEL